MEQARSPDEIKLTVKQEKFAQALVSGMSQREAYKSAYSTKNMKDATIDRTAFELSKHPKISARYNDLLSELKEKSLWTAEQAINDLIWIKEKARSDIQEAGMRMANSSSFLQSVKELNEVSGVMADTNKTAAANLRRLEAQADKSAAEAIIIKTKADVVLKKSESAELMQILINALMDGEDE